MPLDREKQRERQRRYRQRHPERVREGNRRYREENREAVREAGRRSAARLRARGLEHINKIKAEGSCADCGESFHPAAMDFHHCKGDKTLDVAHMRHYSPERLQAEIDKCELLCANCHRVRHAGT